MVLEGDDHPHCQATLILPKFARVEKIKYWVLQNCCMKWISTIIMVQLSEFPQITPPNHKGFVPVWRMMITSVCMIRVGEAGQTSNGGGGFTKTAYDYAQFCVLWVTLQCIRLALQYIRLLMSVMAGPVPYMSGLHVCTGRCIDAWFKDSAGSSPVLFDAITVFLISDFQRLKIEVTLLLYGGDILVCILCISSAYAAPSCCANPPFSEFALENSQPRGKLCTVCSFGARCHISPASVSKYWSGGGDSAIPISYPQTV